MKNLIEEYGGLVVECLGGAIILAAVFSGFRIIEGIMIKIANYAAG